MRFKFPHSHAFPGGQVVIENDGTTEPECLVEFGDGVTVIAEWRSGTADEALQLSIPVYHTAKGTKVSARNWRLTRHSDGTWRSKRMP